MKQIFGAIAHMHHIGICHLDLKPENILLLEKGLAIEDTQLKVTDFGLAAAFGPGTLLKRNVGTPQYMAPEVLAFNTDERADLWSCGVILFVLLFGYLPFNGATVNIALKKVRTGRYRFPKAKDSKVSNQAKDMVRGLLRKDVGRRFTAQRALQQRWLRTLAELPSAAPLDRNTVEKMDKFQAEHNLKKLSKHIIASQLHQSNVRDLQRAFQSLDANGDGEVTREELAAGLIGGHIDVNSESLLRSADFDGSGRISYSEFIAAAMQESTYQKRDVLWQAFNFFDRNGDGKISKAELTEVLQSRASAIKAANDIADDICRMLGEADTDGDDQIDFQEFLLVMGVPDVEVSTSGSEDASPRAFRRLSSTGGRHIFSASCKAAPSRKRHQFRSLDFPNSRWSVGSKDIRKVGM